MSGEQRSSPALMGRATVPVTLIGYGA